MRLWIDCEWNGFGGDLISMAIVAEDGREWYASLGCEKPEPWVAENVMPVIGVEPVDRVEFQTSLRLWLSSFESIHLIADWPEDIAHFCKALITGPGYRLGTPPLTMEVRRIDAPSKLPHNALADARGIRDAILAASGGEVAIKGDRSFTPNLEEPASLEQRARELFDAMMDAAYGNATIGDIVCAETTRGRLEAAWLPLITAALANQHVVLR